jgi:3-hydroxymyristoyl/3-hydroxydecanoyl-(acyl carrier protein) dehydratase
LPILPGVIQIDWAIHLGAQHWPGVRAIASIDRLKFMAPVPPGALLRLALKHDPARRHVRFTYRLGERPCASGVLVYRGAT